MYPSHFPFFLKKISFSLQLTFKRKMHCTWTLWDSGKTIMKIHQRINICLRYAAFIRSLFKLHNQTNWYNVYFVYLNALIIAFPLSLKKNISYKNLISLMFNVCYLLTFADYFYLIENISVALFTYLECIKAAIFLTLFFNPFLHISQLKYR